jgi:hypothetical protein
MTRLVENKALDEALCQLEYVLESPIVEGELPTWADELREAANRLGAQLSGEVRAQHEEQFQRIRKEDTDLLRRIEQLKLEDEALRKLHDEFSRGVDMLHDRAVRVEPHEGKLEPVVSKLVDAGLQLVIRIRKQERALMTWLVESFNRDRGVGD